LRAEGFSCSSGILYVGLEISKLQFLIKKEKKIFCIFLIFGHQNPGSGWDPDPDSMNPDPTLVARVF
jgi:hypothetical protein